MTLAFSQQIKGKPTYFPEKIWAGIKNREITIELGDYLRSPFSTGKNILELKPKLHTIREDKKNRWRTGNKIHFVINNRTKNRLQFAPVLMVKTIQEIKITYDEDICEKECCEPCVFIDGKSIDYNDYERLAINDGFDSVKEFFEWFNEDFEGKIIHWTDIRY